MSEWTAEDEPQPERLGMLFNAIARLAAPAHIQLRYLRDYLPSIDELGLEFDDEFQQLEGYVQRQWIPVNQGRLIERLDEAIGEISDDEHEELWTPNALESASEWQLVRQTAWDVLIFNEKD